MKHLICLLIVVFSNILYAQDGQLGRVLANVRGLTWDSLKFSVHAGFVYQLATGDGTSNFTRTVSAARASDNTQTFTDEIGNYLSPVIGVRVGVPLHARLQAGAGLQYARLGFSMRLESTSRNPEFRYDRVGLYEAKLRASTLEVPLWVSYDLNKDISIGGGLTLGFIVGGSASTLYRHDVYINGAWDVDYSMPGETHTATIMDVTRRFYPALDVRGAYRLPYRLSLEATVKYTGTYTDWPAGRMRALGLGLGLVYALR